MITLRFVSTSVTLHNYYLLRTLWIVGLEPPVTPFLESLQVQRSLCLPSAPCVPTSAACAQDRPSWCWSSWCNQPSIILPFLLLRTLLFCMIAVMAARLCLSCGQVWGSRFESGGMTGKLLRMWWCGFQHRPACRSARVSSFWHSGASWGGDQGPAVSPPSFRAAVHFPPGSSHPLLELRWHPSFIVPSCFTVFQLYPCHHLADFEIDHYSL